MGVVCKLHQLDTIAQQSCCLQHVCRRCACKALYLRVCDPSLQQVPSEELASRLILRCQESRGQRVWFASAERRRKVITHCRLSPACAQAKPFLCTRVVKSQESRVPMRRRARGPQS